MIFAFLAYKGQFLDAGLRFADLVADWKTLDTHVDRIADIALEPPEDDPPSRPRTGKPAFTGRIELAGVSFAYGRGTPQILRRASLTVAPRDSVAITGATGSGNLTLPMLLPRFHAPPGHH